MGFSITSALFGGTIIIAYTITIVYARYSYYYYEDEFVYDPINGWTSFKRYRDKRYPYDAKMGLAAVILLLGVIEVVTGIWVSVCLCMMKPCCTDSQVSFLFSSIQGARQTTVYQGIASLRGFKLLKKL